MSQIIKNTPYKTYLALWGTGFAFVFFIASPTQTWSKFLEIFKLDKVHFFLSLSLAIVCLFLSIIYFIITYRELNLLNDFLDLNLAPRVQSRTYFLLIFIPILLGILLSTTHTIMIFSIIIVFYNLFDTLGGVLLDKNIRSLVELKLREKNQQEIRNILIAIKNYYLKSPIIRRNIIIMFINGIAVSFSATFYFTNETLYRDIAYLIVISNIVFGEVVIHSWRRKRDKIIYENESILKK